MRATPRKSWKSSLPALLLATTLALPAVLLAAESAAPAWPANTKVVEAKIAKIVFPEGRQEFSLPQLRVYDRQGRRVLERLGYYAPTFASFVGRSLDGGSPADPSHTLADELDWIVGTDGKPLAALPEADYTIVDYWASWCAPCRTQSRDLQTILTARPKVRVNLLHVEADTAKMTQAEIKKMIEDGRASVAKKKAGGT
jgi:thiol-disulfide isomerase/thioredoxin